MRLQLLAPPRSLFELCAHSQVSSFLPAALSYVVVVVAVVVVVESSKIFRGGYREILKQE